MKCKSCGGEIAKYTKICDNCGFDIEAFNKLQRVVVEVDPDIDEKHKSNLVDSPVLAFIFGVLSVVFSILFIVNQSVVVLYILLVILFNYLTFTMASKPARIKYKPLANVGKVMAYISIGFIVLKFVFEIFGLLFF